MSDENGSFALEATASNQLVRISSIGFETIYKSINTPDLGIIRLASDVQQLGEVVVKGSLPITRMKGNTMVTSVSGTVLEKQELPNNYSTKSLM